MSNRSNLWQCWRISIRGLSLTIFYTSSALAQVNFPQPPINPNTPICPSPVLSRLKRHKILTGQTVQSIAQQYNLIPETLIRLNPILKGKTPINQEILIPPFNGIRVTAPKGSTWQDLAEAYGIRADILFELNGCVKTPTVVFIPGTNWSSNTPKQDYLGLSGYPLPFIAPIGLKYGWQQNTIAQNRLFHSGVDLLADVGTSVLAAETGQVVYLGQEGAYGILIVINHPGDRQTRYAHLERVNVKIGQSVQTGDVIGAVGTTGQPDIPTPHLHFEVRTKLSVGWVAQDPEIHFQSKPESK